MSVRVMSAVWDLDLSTFEKLVLLALADCANDDGECWPSIATLKRKTGAGERTIQRSINALEAAGVLKRVIVVGKGNRYFVLPRHSGTPAAKAPPPEKTQTPATVAPKPSRTINSKHTDPRGRLIPDDWQPAEFGSGSKSAAIVAALDREQLETTIEHFIAHHQAKRTMATDWQPWWKTWVLNSKKFGASNGRRDQDLRQHRQQSDDRRNSLTRACDDALDHLGRG